jgi:hypothetical protein
MKRMGEIIFGLFLPHSIKGRERELLAEIKKA